MLPETLRLADYGLGHDARATEHQPVAARLGERFLPWQLEQGVEESWEECARHAETIEKILGVGLTTKEEKKAAESPALVRGPEVNRRGQVMMFAADAMSGGKPYQLPLDLPPEPTVAQPTNLVALPSPTVSPASQHSRREALPAWDPEVLRAVAARASLSFTAGRWATTLSGEALGMQVLAAVLRSLPSPASRDHVERAVVLALLPSLMHSRLDPHARASWRRVIGAADMARASVTAFSIPWHNVVRRATLEHVLVVTPEDQWGRGPDVEDAPSPELDARALVALSWLASALAEDQQPLTTHLEDLRAA